MAAMWRELLPPMALTRKPKEWLLMLALFPAKCLMSGSGFASDVVSGIYWAVDGLMELLELAMGSADAIGLSLGTSAPYLYKRFLRRCFARPRLMLLNMRFKNNVTVDLSPPATAGTWAFYIGLYQLLYHRWALLIAAIRSLVFPAGATLWIFLLPE